MIDGLRKTSVQPKINLYAWIVWGLAALFFLSEYFARVAPSVMVPDLMQHFQVQAFQLGALSAFFYYAYIAMQLPVGTLVDRFGPHRLLTAAAAICGLSVIAFAHTQYIEYADFARLLMGFSASFAFVGALKLATVWFPASRFGMIAGATQALGMLGAAVGEGPVAILVEHYGWRFSIELIGIILLVIAFLIGLFVRDNPKTIVAVKVSQQKPISILNALKQVLTNSQTWINGIFVGFLYAPTAALALWGVSYLHAVYHIDIEIAAIAVSMIFIGWAIGGPLAGWVSDYIQRRRPVMLVSAVMSLIFLSCVLYIPHLNIVLVFLLLFFYGMSNVAVATAYAVAAEIVPRRMAGTSMSFANMSSVIIGATFQPLIGYLLGLGWDHKIINQVPVYSAHDYRMAMLVLPFGFIISIIAVFILRESYQSH